MYSNETNRVYKEFDEFLEPYFSELLKNWNKLDISDEVDISTWQFD